MLLRSYRHRRVANARKRPASNPLRADPTRTATLRRQFETALMLRFNRVKRKLWELVAKEDAFGLAVENYNPNQPRDDRGKWSTRSSSGGGIVGLEDSTRQKKVETFVHVLQSRGYDVQSSSSRSTSSEYTYVGKNKTEGGFVTEFTVRIADHPKPGWSRGGWIESLKMYDIRPRSLDAGMARVLKKRVSPLGSTLQRAMEPLVNAYSPAVENYNPNQPLIRNQRFRFQTTSGQVEAFQRWLTGVIQAEILIGASGTDRAYWLAYVQEGYSKGAGRAFDEVHRKQRVDEKLGDWYKGTREDFLQSSFGQPVIVDKVKLLAGRVYTDLQGITEAMSTQINRTLTDGLVQGKNPVVIARDLQKNVEDIGKVRARALAQTEIIRAHAEGELDSLERMGLDKVSVMVEWATAGFDVCPACQALEGVVLTVKESHGLLPRHVNCRCAFLPANLGESTKGQVRGYGPVSQALRDSLKTELPKIKKHTLAEQRAKSSWAGANRVIARKRPNPLVKPTKD